jgi:hypothetical protein
VPRRRINDIEPKVDPTRDTMPIMSHVAKRGTKPLSFLSVAEIKALLGVITAPRDRAIFSVAHHRGLRASEVGMIEPGPMFPGRQSRPIHRRTLHKLMRKYGAAVGCKAGSATAASSPP